ncbi:hypothetical protein BDW71DRAFT_175290 [Aspergillus fruticulosus]
MQQCTNKPCTRKVHRHNSLRWRADQLRTISFANSVGAVTIHIDASVGFVGVAWALLSRVLLATRG